MLFAQAVDGSVRALDIPSHGVVTLSTKGRRYLIVAMFVASYPLFREFDSCHSKVPVSPFDNALAVDQIEVAYSTLLNRVPAGTSKKEHTRALSKDGLEHPRIVSLGGDHTIVSLHSTIAYLASNIKV
ncbi:hypothetical protein C0995_010455 [Termitomyces sp. Mi166|nr:hypothetical protein C0995_010455 [Termitomyces sp. Mi166\